jgi:hypothetical protein
MCNKKECCKNCESLNFYDWYFCDNEKVQNIERKEFLTIHDIENSKCELYFERNGEFWINENSNKFT